MARIICLSDLHYSVGESDIYGEEINTELTNKLKTDRLNLLFSALEDLGEIDLLIFCGDIVLGRESKENKIEAIKIFTEFLERIENSVRIFNNDIKDFSQRILIVPGNHDINREDKDVLVEFKLRLKKYVNPYFSIKRMHPFAPIFIFDDIKLIIACESTVELGATENTKIKKAIEKINVLEIDEETKNELKNLLKDDAVYDIPAITEETRNSFIENCKEIKAIKKYNDYNKIMVTHHPLIDSVEVGKAAKKFKSTIGGYSFIKTAKEYGYNLFLHGHIHEKSCVKIIDYNSDKKTPLMQVGIPNVIIDEDKAGAVLIATENSAHKGEIINFLKIIDMTKSFKITETIDNTNNKVIDDYHGNITLVDRDIQQLITENTVIKNGNIRNIEAASYNCALGYNYKIGIGKYCKWHEIEESKIQSVNGPAYIELKPNETVLIYTYEDFDLPDNMIMHASPISSWLRRGISVEMSYFVDPGFKGKFCFPITNKSDDIIQISSRDPIMSVEIIKLGRNCSENWSERHPNKKKKRSQLED